MLCEILPWCLFCAGQNTHHACSSNTILSLDHHTTSWLTPTLSISLSRPNWTLFSLWWIVCMQNVSNIVDNVHISIYTLYTKCLSNFIPCRYSLYHRLCNGWDWKAWNEVQGCTQVRVKPEHVSSLVVSYLTFKMNLQDSQGSKVWAPSVHTQRNIRRWLFSPEGYTGTLRFSLHQGCTPTAFFSPVIFSMM